MNQWIYVTLSALVAVCSAGRVRSPHDPFKTVQPDSELWQEMEQMVGEFAGGLVQKDVPRIMKLFSNNSWTQPPMHIGITTMEDTEDFMDLMVHTKNDIKETNLFEVGGNDVMAWARGSANINGAHSLFGTICYRETDNSWKMVLLAWAISAENPTPLFLQVLREEAAKAQAQLEKQQN